MADPAGFVLLGVGGFTIGMLIGMALKAVARLAMYVAGLYLASLVALSSMGLIIVNWEGLANLAGTILNFMTSMTNSGAVQSAGVFGTVTVLGAIYGAIRAEIQVRENQKFRYFKKLE